MINKIHCFGTSFTAGGGFEWDSVLKRDTLLENYTEQPFSQEHYSYPGQLQKLVGDTIQVFNYGKSGYGNERMYRKAYNIISESKNLDNQFFIFEFSHTGRKEIWSNTFNKYIIVNYYFNDDGSHGIGGVADRYFYNDREVSDKLRPLVDDFFKETIQLEAQFDLVKQNNDMFIDYLLYNKINFLVVQEPFDHKTTEKIKPYTMDFGNGTRNMINYAFETKLTITDETNGKIEDLHCGLKGNRFIAQKIAKHLNLKIDLKMI